MDAYTATARIKVIWSPNKPTIHVESESSGHIMKTNKLQRTVSSIKYSALSFFEKLAIHFGTHQLYARDMFLNQPESNIF